MRKTVVINKSWNFQKGVSAVPSCFPSDWEATDLPFTWNGVDGQDGGNDYFRGSCCFVKQILKAEIPQTDEIYVQFDGVNSSANVFFNGESIAVHHGGYSTFRAKLSNIKEENLLAVIVDNGDNDFVYPQMADFTFYGGIYRDVSLIGVGKEHFDLDYYGTPGIAVTPEIKGRDAEVELQAYANGTVEFTVTDGESVVATVKAEGKNPKAKIILSNVHLWDGVKDPFLYTATARLIVDGKAVDEISTHFGCRSFQIDSQKGFILNGREYPLRGVSRHQDRPGIGNALLPEHHREDMEIICEMGANTIRLAHYQHAQEFYDLCDEKGMVVWAEIPYISEHLPNGKANTVSQLRELILQNYNHPCIVVWGLSNEISMHSELNEELLENHRMLNDLAHRLDKTRQTTLAVLSMCDPNEQYVHISDVVSYNHYFGWYGGSTDMYKPWFDRFHKKYPDKAIGLSEYGCEALNWHSSTPVQGDYTEEYQAHYHEELIKQISDMPYLWATHVWNMFDFAADARAEGGENGMNHKGLVTFDRKYKKDAFYAYQAWLSDKPMLHICGKKYTDRAEAVTKVTVYSNQPEVEIFINGKSIDKQKKGKYPFFYFEIPLENKTKVTAKAGSITDEAVFRKVEKFNDEYRLKDEGDVLNWFELTMPEGFFSINNTVGDIMSTFKGKCFLLKLLVKAGKTMLKKHGNRPTDNSKPKPAGVSVKQFSLSKTTLELAKGFSVKRLIKMLHIDFSKEELLALNGNLNKIKKPATKNQVK